MPTSDNLGEVWISCGCCPAFAGILRLDDADGTITLVRRSFTGTLTQPMSAAQARRLHDAMYTGTGAARAIHAVDPELAPFYCPVCDASFCGEHWTRWDVFDDDHPDWRDSIRGRCPHGHERMLED